MHGRESLEQGWITLRKSVLQAQISVLAYSATAFTIENSTGRRY